MMQILFFFFAAVAVGAAINVLVQKHVLYSSLSLILMLTAMSALFVLLQADFLAVINVIVYAGAIMVLFVFVIMLLNAGTEKKMVVRPLGKYLGAPLLLLFLGMIAYVIQRILPGRLRSRVRLLRERSQADNSRRAHREIKARC